MNQSFQASLEEFQGPLDLMLHLVRENKLDLLNLNLEKLAEQYIRYIQQQKELDLASEYLVEFSRLLEYKSSRLLPLPEKEDETDTLQDEYQRRLVEYKKYKEVSEKLEELYRSAFNELGRPADPIYFELQGFETSVLKMPGVENLSKTFLRILKKSRLQNEQVLPERELNIDEVLERMKKRLIPHQRISLEQILAECNSRLERIVTFLAVLECISKKEMEIVEDDLVWIKNP